MVQNKNKLIELFIGNVSNAVVHGILQKAIEKEQIADKYRKELKNSFELAKKYREKINPINSVLPTEDASYIRNKIIKKVKSELMIRINKGYENISLELIESSVDKLLKETKIIK